MEALHETRRHESEPLAPDVIFDLADARRIEQDLPYAGAVTPREAWELLTQGQAKLIDVRTAPEVKFVGSIPDSTHIEWRGADYLPSAMFVNALRGAAHPSETVLLICRSGVRSHQAARAAAIGGFKKVYNVLEGFEGQRSHAGRRGEIDGWRKHGLPWTQD
jgi:rhodanese-related sulfurtransferase